MVELSTERSRHSIHRRADETHLGTKVVSTRSAELAIRALVEPQAGSFVLKPISESETGKIGKQWPYQSGNLKNHPDEHQRIVLKFVMDQEIVGQSQFQPMDGKENGIVLGLCQSA